MEKITPEDVIKSIAINLKPIWDYDFEVRKKLAQAFSNSKPVKNKDGTYTHEFKSKDAVK